MKKVMLFGLLLGSVTLISPMEQKTHHNDNDGVRTGGSDMAPIILPHGKALYDRTVREQQHGSQRLVVQEDRQQEKQ